MTEEERIHQDYLNELRSHRHDLLAIQKEQVASYDKAIFGLSGGALGVTIAFADKFSEGVPEVTWALLGAWGAFSAALLLNAFSHLSSNYDMEKEIGKVLDSIKENGSDFPSGNFWRRITEACNMLALVAFTGGVCLFGLHAYTASEAALQGGTEQDAGRGKEEADADRKRPDQPESTGPGDEGDD